MNRTIGIVLVLLVVLGLAVFINAQRQEGTNGEGDQPLPPVTESPAEPAIPPEVSPEESESTSQWEDGTYTARTETDESGYYGEIELIIEESRITEVTYDEKDQEGTPKGEDYPYPLGPESEDEFEAQLLETQDPEQVDNITGATQTWERFKETATEALEEASQGQGSVEENPQDEGSRAQSG